MKVSKRIAPVIIKTVIAPAIAIFLTNRWNLFVFFENYGLVTNTQAFSYGVTMYLSLCEAIIYGIGSFFASNKVNIRCIFFINEEITDIRVEPKATFKDDVAQLKCKLILSGKTKHLIKRSISIYFPPWVDATVANNIVSSKDNTYKIDISSLINSNTKSIQEATRTFNIAVIKNYSDDEKGCSDYISAEINRPRGFETNSCKLL